jgi:hypothetical protein
MKSSIFWDITSWRIWGSHCGGYEEFYLLGYNTMESVESQPIFWRNMLPHLCLLLAWVILRPWRRRWHVPLNCRLTSTDYMALHPGRQNYSQTQYACFVTIQHSLSFFCLVFDTCSYFWWKFYFNIPHINSSGGRTVEPFDVKWLRIMFIERFWCYQSFHALVLPES